MRNMQGIMALVPRYAEGGQTARPQNLPDMAKMRRMLQELAMDGEAPDKGPDGKPDVRQINGEWVVMVGGKPRKPVGMAEGGPVASLGDPAAMQRGLRGQYVIPPPPGYVPGFNPEMLYFQNDPENPVIPPYGGPDYWTQQTYGNSPINRFNPAGAPYFESIIPGSQQPPPAGMPQGGGGGIAGIAQYFGGTPGWANPQQSGGSASGPMPGPAVPGTGGNGGAGSGYTTGGGQSVGGPRPAGGAAGGGMYMPGNYAFGGFNSNPGGGQSGGFNDYLNSIIPQGNGMTGYDPSKFEQGLVKYAKPIGAAAGALLGIPFLGQAAGYARDQYMENRAWQSPMSGQDLSGTEIPPLPPSGNDLINQAVNEHPASEASLREAVAGRQSPMPEQLEYRTTLGSWYGFQPPGGGNIKWIHSRSLMNEYAGGGQVTMRTHMGPARMAGGGIAEIPNQFSQQQAPQQAQPSQDDVMMVAAAISGEAGEQADAIINMFIEKYGPEAFRAVREAVLQSIAPNAQTEGMVQGQGGGMDDQVPGMIGSQQPVAVSPGEYIVPADVVSGLGDGSSDAGATELDRMSQNVRMARGGTTTQPPPFDARRVMPA